jgi:SAM-dependent methyltransferase
MPWSSNTFEHIFVDQLISLNPKSVLDVGAGAGKYGRMIQQALPGCRVDAIEPTAEYVNEYKLSDVYSNVYMQDLHGFMDSNNKDTYDLVIFGDVLEHFYRSQVFDILDYFLYKHKWVLVVWPTFLPQEDVGNNSYEVHRSNFKLKDLADKFEVQYYLRHFGHFFPNSSHPCEFHYCLLKGHTVGFHETVYNLVNWRGN